MRNYKVIFSNDDTSYQFNINANGHDAAIENAEKKLKAKLKKDANSIKSFKVTCENITANNDWNSRSDE